MLEGWNNETVLHENRSYFPGERKCIVLALQHGGNDVTCKCSISIYTGQTNEYLLKLGISCTIHWFAKQNGHMRVITFPAYFWPGKFISCHWLFTSVRLAVDIYSTSPLWGLVNIHCYPPSLWWIIIIVNYPICTVGPCSGSLCISVHHCCT